MSKPVKALVRKELVRRLAGVDSLAVVSLAGVGGIEANQLRRDLRAKSIRVTVVKNSLARQALAEAGLAKAADLLEGPCALATGPEGAVAVVRELLERVRTLPKVVVRGAILEGEVYGPERVEELSKFPTRDEAIGGVLTLVLAPARRLAGSLLGAGGRLAGMVKAIEEKAEKAAAAGG